MLVEYGEEMCRRLPPPNDRLTLDHETVRLMTIPELTNAVGGSFTTWFTSMGQQGNSRATCCQQSCGARGCDTARMTADESGAWLIVRRAVEADLDDILAMLDDFVRDHPAARHVRPRAALREAYFGDAPVARLFVAVQRGRVVGMAQWWRIIDMFWAMQGGHAEYFYVRPEARGLGIGAAIIAAICDDIRRCGGVFLHGGGDQPEIVRLYERVALGAPTRDCHVSAEAFQVFADLAGRSPRDVVRGLPAPALNRVPPRPRG